MVFVSLFIARVSKLYCTLPQTLQGGGPDADVPVIDSKRGFTSARSALPTP